ncbi:MAG: hypothetical protein ABJP02_17655 [Parasphingorhabdus sp.]|uniref:hypothetical protein n=1 Tax=Parasphingorhabdus sp. TaxID=2709688 RepID=UPI00329A6931
MQSSVIALLLISSGAQAASEWTGNRKITSIYPYPTGFIFEVDGPKVNDPGCNGNRLNLPITAANYDAIVSSLITAFSAQYNVSANFNNTTTSSCQAVINRVQITP